MYIELNIDALVGPTHHYGGVGVGNLASSAHAHSTSHPRRAALEGLDKANCVASLGIPQFLLPPLLRPEPAFLAKLGFSGPIAEQASSALERAPLAYSAIFSSAFMWAANCGTFAPASDSSDQRNHFTLANLCSSWHRYPESWQRQEQLLEMFDSVQSHHGGGIELHTALPALVPLRDEGAANHMRLCDASGEIGLHVFVYGEAESGLRPKKYFARQTLAACQAIARLHKLDPERTFFLQQHPAAIDAGVFHNDVIATSHQHLFLHHALAYIDADKELERLESTYARLCGRSLLRICIAEEELSLAEAVSSYLFNSQVLSPVPAAAITSKSVDLPKMLILCAAQCARMPRVAKVIERFIADRSNPIEAAHFVNLEESMAGGGGPACLRLRLQLPEAVVAAFAPRHRLTPQRATVWRRAIERYYPEELEWSELADPRCLSQYADAYLALARVLAE